MSIFCLYVYMFSIEIHEILRYLISSKVISSGVRFLKY